MIDARKIAAAFHFLLNPGRYGNPSLKWLFYTSSRCDARFEAQFGEAFKQIQLDAEFQEIASQRGEHLTAQDQTVLNLFFSDDFDHLPARFNIIAINLRQTSQPESAVW